MEKKHIGFDLVQYASAHELPEADRRLLEAAGTALQGAYAPYSRYRVGAAVLLTNGEIVIGSNQENASYPSGLCAERVAVFQAGARFPGVAISCIAIRVQPPGSAPGTPAAPCGNCRQSILEYEHRQHAPIRFLLQSGNGIVYECPSTRALLPLGFDPDALS